jgi:hypothetical protein
MAAIESAALTDALVKELCSGRMLMETRQHLREHVAAHEASMMRGHRSINGLGKCVAVIPQHEWFLMRAKYGDDAMHDKGFIRDFQKHEPSMAVNKI